MRKISYLAFCIFAVACGGGGSSSGTSSDKENIPLKVTTDTSACYGEAKTNNLYKTWKLEAEGNGERTGREGSIVMRLKFRKDSLTVRNQCSVSNTSAEAKATVGIKVDETAKQIFILEEKEASNTWASTTCNIHMKAEVWTYQFRGSCVEISVSGQPMILVPDEFDFDF